jgi:UDP-glucose 4-epimerase
MSEPWVITGANGYLGGELCQGLALRGKHVFAVARAGRALEGLAKAGIACSTYDEMRRILVEGSVLVHCAGKVGVTGSWHEFESVNKDWPLFLFDQAAQSGVRCFIYVSSVAAIGYSNRPDQGTLDETAPSKLLAGELYGRSKWLAEQSLLERAKTVSTRLVILRPGLVYGRRPFGFPQGWLRRGIIADPLQRLPLLHIESFINAVMCVAEHRSASGVFFVVDEEQPRLLEVNELRLKHGILKYQPWRVGRPVFRTLCMLRSLVRILRSKRGTVPKGYARVQYCLNVRRLEYSTKKIRTETGWRPSLTLEEGIKTCRYETQKRT